MFKKLSEKKYIVSWFVLYALLVLTDIVSGARRGDKVMFLRGTEVWTTKADGSDLKQLTNDGKAKGSPLWSPDGTKIAYHTRPDPEERSDSREAGNGIISKIIVISNEGERLNSILILSEMLINAVEGMEWIDNNRFGYDGHINPSIGEYRVVDIKTGKVIAAYLGARFKWSPDRTKLAQLGQIVHFAPSETQNYSVQVNGKTVYSLPKDTLKHYITTELSWSPDSKRLAFIEKSETASKEMLTILSGGNQEIVWELPEDMKGVRSIKWLDQETMLLGESIWRLTRTKRQLEPLAEDDQKTRLAILQKERKEKHEREKLIQSLSGTDPDWWFER